jgi:hypothetical protein
MDRTFALDEPDHLLHSVFRGTASELLYELKTHDRSEARPSEWQKWPRDVADFGRQLRRVAAPLRKVQPEGTVGDYPAGLS